ncbi:MAG: 3-oxoacyl-ACP reductase FabG [Clostridia bacterium]|nr:3-oxoacyl-ACP reductase FabG [Clostridia bacterium]
MKVALVTGASRGIGEAIARRLAEDGMFVYVNYQNSKEQAEKIAEEIGGMAICADVSNETAVKNMIETIEKQHGGVDILVNNAGISIVKMLCDTEKAEWDRIFSVNVGGVYNVTKAVMGNMVKNRSGRIINISSIWGEVGASCEVAYSATKAAVIGFTKALAKELAPSKVTVNAITPGIIDTEMNAEFTAEEKAEFVSEIPLLREGTPREVADLVSFLASEDAKYITGQTIGINGGL